jgi:protein-S-isoprenylcysteine O-methyltransferase Ste14
MRASDFEFRHRFWFFGGAFSLAFSGYFVQHYPMAWLVGRDAWRWVLAGGAVLVALAAALRTWAAAYLKSDVVHDRSLHSDRLVADGPYRHLRNPLYLGTLLLALGFGLMAPPIGFAVLAVGATVFVLRLIGREEAELAQTQGDSYREFLRRVPKMLPAIAPRLPASGAAPQWKQAITGELFMWGMALALASYCVTLDLRVMWALMALAFATKFPWRRWVSAR